VHREGYQENKQGPLSLSTSLKKSEKPEKGEAHEISSSNIREEKTDF
jgi:hypothetical protein